jgi:hypothetical protein
MTGDELQTVLKGLLDQVEAARSENIAIQYAIAVLMAEVSVVADDPHQKMDKMVAALQGTAAAVAETISNTQVVTTAIDRICSMAAAMLNPRLK